MSALPAVSVILWPIDPWPQMAEHWRRAEEFGFPTAWIYDHLAWRGHTPWDEAFTSMAAAAMVTSTMKLGTLVTTPNFRDPIPTAAQIRTVDRISGGRIRVGIGAGGDKHESDGDVLGRVWTTGERADRFAEYVAGLDALLTEPEASYTGEYFSADRVTIADGLVQQRPPFLVAANGPRGMALAAQYGQGWIANAQVADPEGAFAYVKRSMHRLEDVCTEHGRASAELEKVLLTGFTEEPWTKSLTAFQDLRARYGELGITEIAIHWPRPNSEWSAEWSVFESIATDLRGEHGG